MNKIIFSRFYKLFNLFKLHLAYRNKTYLMENSGELSNPLPKSKPLLCRLWLMEVHLKNWDQIEISNMASGNSPQGTLMSLYSIKIRITMLSTPNPIHTECNHISKIFQKGLRNEWRSIITLFLPLSKIQWNLSPEFTVYPSDCGKEWLWISQIPGHCFMSLLECIPECILLL